MTTPDEALAALAAFGARLAGVCDVEEILDTALDATVELLGHPHVLLLLHDPATDRLVTVASRGYDTAGVGSEVLIGQGVIGTAAAGRRPMRIGNLQRMLAYARAAQQRPAPWIPGAEAPLPGLRNARSQLAAPMVVAGNLVGALAVESERAMRYDQNDEHVLTVAAQLVAALLADQLAAGPPPDAIDVAAAQVTTGAAARSATDTGSTATATPRPAARSEPTVLVRHYVVDGSTFLDDEYLIKGVAGRLLWKLVAEHGATGRTGYTNREVRLDPALEMPAIKDNFESRLVLLKRRLEEREAPIRIHRPARGRFEVEVTAPLRLERVAVSET